MINRVVRIIEYNTDAGEPDTISAAHIRVHLCANRTYPIEEANQATAAALERGDFVDENAKCAPASPNIY
ncbi:hypothetical protein [Halalkalicoccus subterraneus]|uniref:hypothetical protein n=1 Tax=Halalkalicoccus subterraneus TaxID=2675002 RepID=UPI000EFD95EF|nr:hypothetical protein [Halalkalicoccus subterraneus]